MDGFRFFLAETFCKKKKKKKEEKHRKTDFAINLTNSDYFWKAWPEKDLRLKERCHSRRESILKWNVHDKYSRRQMVKKGGWQKENRSKIRNKRKVFTAVCNKLLEVFSFKNGFNSFNSNFNQKNEIPVVQRWQALEAFWSVTQLVPGYSYMQINTICMWNGCPAYEGNTSMAIWLAEDMCIKFCLILQKWSKIYCR